MEIYALKQIPFCIIQIILIYPIPVNDLQPVLDIISAFVVMLQIIGMLPHVNIQEGIHIHGQRGILICSCDNVRIPEGVDHQPCVSGSKYGQSCLGQYLLKYIQAFIL